MTCQSCTILVALLLIAGIITVLLTLFTTRNHIMPRRHVDLTLLTEAKGRIVMDDLAELLDNVLNDERKRTGFVLMVFPFSPTGATYYVSNAEPSGAAALLRRWVQRLEFRKVSIINNRP